MAYSFGGYGNYSYGNSTPSTPTSVPGWMDSWAKLAQQKAEQERKVAQQQANTPSWLRNIQDNAAKLINSSPLLQNVGKQAAKTASTAASGAQWLGNTLTREIINPMVNATRTTDQAVKSVFQQQAPGWFGQSAAVNSYQQSPAVVPYGTYYRPGGWSNGSYSAPRLETAMPFTSEITDPVARRLAVLAKYPRLAQPDVRAQEDPEDAMWRALNEAGLLSAQGIRTLSQMGGANWQRALLRSLTPITVAAQASSPASGTAWSETPRSWGGGYGGYYRTPTVNYTSNTPAWANGLVNWRIS